MMDAERDGVDDLRTSRALLISKEALVLVVKGVLAPGGGIDPAISSLEETCENLVQVAKWNITWTAVMRTVAFPAVGLEPASPSLDDKVSARVSLQVVGE